MRVSGHRLISTCFLLSVFCLLSSGCLGPVYGIYELTKTKEEDKNDRPVIEAGIMSRQYDASAVNIPVTLADANGDACSVSVRYALSPWDTWTDCTGITGNTGLGAGAHTIAWDAVTDLGTAATTVDVKVRLIPNDGEDQGFPSQTNAFHVGNDAPVVVVTTPVGMQSGNVVVDYTLADPASDDSQVLVQYGPSPTGPWTDCTSASISPNPEPQVESGPVPIPHSFVWDSAADLGPLSLDGYLRVSAQDGEPAIGSEVTGAITVNNNQAPSVTFLTTSLVLNDTYGIIPIPFRIRDPEGDTCSVSIQYSLETETTWNDCTEYPSRMSAGTAGLGSYTLAGNEKTGEHLFLWNSFHDIRRVDALCEIRIMATDSAANDSSQVLKGIPCANMSPCIGDQETFPTGSTPRGITICDINGDGYGDIVCCSRNANALTISYGSAAGCSLTPDTLAVSNQPLFVTAADINQDGYDDIIATHDFGTVLTISYGSPAGHSDPADTLTVGSTGHHATTGDIDGDGFPDIVVANWNSDTLSISYGSAGGHSDPVDTLVVGDRPSFVTIGDINNDGYGDIVCANTVNLGIASVSISYGSAGGHEDPARTMTCGFETYRVALGDLNGDGYDDIVALNGSSTDNLTISYGGPGIPGHDPTPDTLDLGVVASYDGEYVICTDLNLDGYDDIVVNVMGAGTGELKVSYGSAAGHSDPVDTYLSRGNDPYWMAHGDMNGDDWPEIVVINQSSNNFSICSWGESGFSDPAETVGAGAYPWYVTMGDINGDGFDDIAASNNSDNTVTVCYGKALGYQEPLEDIPTGDSPYGVACGDFNMDGFQEIVSCNATQNTMTINYGEAAGRRDLSVELATGGDLPIIPATGDFNRDGYDDLVWAGFGPLFAVTPGPFGVSYGGTSGHEDPGTQIGPGGKYYHTGVGDINGDGYDDVIGSDRFADVVSVSLGGVSGLANPATNLALSAGANPQFSFITDLNGDGYGEIVACGYGTDTLEISYGTAGGHTDPVEVLAAGNTPFWGASGDLNGDGYRDMVSTNNASDNITISYGSAAGYSNPADFVAVGASPEGIAVGDINGDGYADFASTNRSDDTISICYGSRAGAVGPAQTIPAGSEPGLIVIGDIDGDGYGDIAAANVVSGDYTLSYGGAQGHSDPVTIAAGAFSAFMEMKDVNADGFPDVVSSNTYSMAFALILGETSGVGRRLVVDTASAYTFKLKDAKIDFPAGSFAAPQDTTLWLSSQPIRIKHPAPGTTAQIPVPASFAWDLMRFDVVLDANAATLTLPLSPSVEDSRLDWAHLRLYRYHWGPDPLDHRDDIVEIAATTEGGTPTLTIDPLTRTVTTTGAGDITRYGKYQVFQVTDDSDDDGLPDAWEMHFFSDLDQDDTTNFDGDAVLDIDEYKAGTDPTTP